MSVSRHASVAQRRAFIAERILNMKTTTGVAGQSSGTDARCAFSLIELVTVLVIIAILAATATAAMATSISTRRNMAGQQLVGDLIFARGRASATGVRSWVALDSTTNTYTIKAESLASPGYAGATALTDPATGKNYTITLNAGDFLGVSITNISIAGGGTVGFDWLGRPLLPAGTLITADSTITLTGNVVVTIKGGTGHVMFTPGS